MRAKIEYHRMNFFMHCVILSWFAADNQTAIGQLLPHEKGIYNPPILLDMNNKKSRLES